MPCCSLAVIGILAALYVWFFVYNKSHRDYEKADPDHVLAAEELYDQYKQNKSLADSLYTGMVLQIDGNLSKIESADTLLIVVFAFEQGMFGEEGVRCVLLQNQHEKISTYSDNDPITLKGYCTGYNDTDVIIEKVSVITTN
ncbi:MAG: hypothetical protein RQ761_02650 [Bacteroidales bacterium]|nr:hypothetical protein [Bacteroidales bacterium]